MGRICLDSRIMKLYFPLCPLKVWFLEKGPMSMSCAITNDYNFSSSLTFTRHECALFTFVWSFLATISVICCVTVQHNYWRKTQSQCTKTQRHTLAQCEVSQFILRTFIQTADYRKSLYLALPILIMQLNVHTSCMSVCVCFRWWYHNRKHGLQLWIWPIWWHV